MTQSRSHRGVLLAAASHRNHAGSCQATSEPQPPKAGVNGNAMPLAGEAVFRTPTPSISSHIEPSRVPERSNPRSQQPRRAEARAGRRRNQRHWTNIMFFVSAQIALLAQQQLPAIRNASSSISAPYRLYLGVADGMSIARVWAGTQNDRLSSARRSF